MPFYKTSDNPNGGGEGPIAESVPRKRVTIVDPKESAAYSDVPTYAIPWYTNNWVIGGIVATVLILVLSVGALIYYYYPSTTRKEFFYSNNPTSSAAYYR